MTFRLQQFGIHESSYERPTQKWVCGRAADGASCRVGPDRRGRCRATFECRPLKQRDRWQCTRPAGAGGRCADGPLPDGACCRPIASCQPVRSMRARRGMVVGLVVAFTAAGLAVMALGPRREQFLSPGPLASAHANLLIAVADEPGRGCGACHAAADGPPNLWLTRIVNRPSAAEESHRCVRCHALPDASAAHALRPHTMSSDELERLSGNNAEGETAGTPLRLLLARAAFGADGSGEVGCASCHREHRGRHADLKSLGEAQCQSCHARQFASFIDGHPEFSSDYPHTRRTRIAFNHSRHHFQHFPGAGALIECTNCHAMDHTGRHMIVKGFDAACASCHGESIRSAPPVSFIQLPSIDLESLPDEGAGLGTTHEAAWPWSADVDDESDPSAFLNLLLSANEDPAVAIALGRLEEEGLDLYDLSDADDDSLAAAERVIWAVRELFVNLAAGDAATVGRRLAAMAGGEATAGEVAALAGRLPDTPRHPVQELPSILKTAEAAWFSGARADVNRYLESGHTWQQSEAEEETASNAPSPSLDPSADIEQLLGKTPGWHIDPDGQSIAYVPAGHGDPFLRAWINAAGRSANPFARAMFDELMDQKKDPGNCSKCHSVDEQPDGSRIVHWTGRKPWTRRQELSTFAHGPHFNEPSLQNCLSCHDVLRGGDKTRWDSAYAWGQFDPTVIAPHLARIERANCARCHTPEQAGMDCLACHSYHHSPMTSRPITASLGQQEAGSAPAASSPAPP